MKKIWNEFKRNILLYTVATLILFIISHFILNLLNIKYRQWVYYTVILLSTIGIIIGTIQLIRKRNKTVKIVSSIIGTIIAFFVIYYWQLFVLGFALSYLPEHIVSRDGKIYVAYVRSFLQVNVDYYDYINFFLVGNNVKMSEYYGKGGYDPFDGKHDEYKPQQIEYYDDTGKLKKTNNSGNESKISNQENVTSNKDNSRTNEILYEKKIDDNITIRVVHLDYILAQRSIISIEKTIDGGKNWLNQIESSDGCIQIHNGAKFVFINENIGFINDPGLAGTSGDNRGLLVTIDGGKNFTEANIILNNLAQNIYIDDVPYQENSILKLKTHIIKDSKKEYYYFYSVDNGITWNMCNTNCN